MSKHSLKYTHKCGQPAAIKKVRTDIVKDIEEPATPKAIPRTMTQRSEDELVEAPVAVLIGNVKNQLLLDTIQKSVENFEKSEMNKIQKKQLKYKSLTAQACA